MDKEQLFMRLDRLMTQRNVKVYISDSRNIVVQHYETQIAVLDYEKNKLKIEVGLWTTEMTKQQLNKLFEILKLSIRLKRNRILHKIHEKCYRQEWKVENTFGTYIFRQPYVTTVFYSELN